MKQAVNNLSKECSRGTLRRESLLAWSGKESSVKPWDSRNLSKGTKVPSFQNSVKVSWFLYVVMLNFSYCFRPGRQFLVLAISHFAPNSCSMAVYGKSTSSSNFDDKALERWGSMTRVTGPDCWPSTCSVQLGKYRSNCVCGLPASANVQTIVKQINTLILSKRSPH